MRGMKTFGPVVLLVFVGLGAGCRDQYEKMQKATDKEQQSLTERYKALVDEAKKLKAEDSLQLLHHFSNATLSGVQTDEFKGKAAKFIADAATGKYDKVEIRGARAPGRLRLLLVTIGGAKGNLPFVQSPDGFKFDDIDIAFGNFEKAVNIHGASPAYPPSTLSSLAILQDSQASTKEKVQASIRMATAKDKDTCDRFAAGEKNAWAKTSLLYASWKSGGPCEPFAQSFPMTREAQTELYDADADDYSALVVGLTDCATASKTLAPTLKVYQGCYQADEKPRSVYVQPLINLASAKPENILKAALQTNYKYEEDPVAIIMVGALHGETGNAFFQYLNNNAKQNSPLGKLAKSWLDKMAERDKEEPPEGQQPAGGQPAPGGKQP